MSEMSWEEYASRLPQAVVFLPVGALEQHGRHLPLGTDSINAMAMAEAVAIKVDGIVCPPMAFGYKSLLFSGGGQTFPGTTSLSASSLIGTVKDVLLELIRHGAQRIVLFDGHYENGMFLHEAADLTLRESGASLVRIMRMSPGSMSQTMVQELEQYGMKTMSLEHAGLVETSLMLHVRPDLVKMTQAEDVPQFQVPEYEVLPEQPSRIHSSGALSTPVRADAELGKRIFDDIVATAAAAVLREFGPEQD